MNDLESGLKQLRPVSPPRPPWMRLEEAPSGRLSNRRLVFVGFAAVLFVGILGWVILAPPALPPVHGPLGSIAGKSEERPRPIRRTDLRGAFGAWRNLPFDISPEEKAAVHRCEALAREANHTVNGVSQYIAKAVKDELEAILEKRPGFFYAEHLLGLWFDLQDQKDQARTWYQRALEHAPVILVQDFLQSDGRPYPDLPITIISIDCNRVKAHERLGSITLFFPQLHTDRRGRILLPVYESVYEVSTFMYPSAFSIERENPSYYESPGKVGLLPALIVRKR